MDDWFFPSDFRLPRIELYPREISIHTYPPPYIVVYPRTIRRASDKFNTPEEAAIRVLDTPE
jgi:hypothetical protein